MNWLNGWVVAKAAETKAEVLECHFSRYDFTFMSECVDGPVHTYVQCTHTTALFYTLRN